MMRHSPVVGKLGEKLNRGPPGRQPQSSSYHAHSFKNLAVCQGLTVGTRCYSELRSAPTSGPHFTDSHGKAGAGYAALRTVQPLADGAATGSIRHSAGFGIASYAACGIDGGRAPGCATWREGNWNRSSFSSDTSQIQTTERYLGCKQRIRSAVNDQIGIEPAN